MGYLGRIAEQTAFSFAVWKRNVDRRHHNARVLRQICRYIHWRHDRHVGGDEGAHWDRVVRWDPRVAATVQRCETGRF